MNNDLILIYIKQNLFQVYMLHDFILQMVIFLLMIVVFEMLIIF